MGSEHDDITLKSMMRSIHARWGADALRKFDSRQPANITLPTGHAALDDALNGGLPIARLTELCGTPTSGATTLALNLVTAAQSAGYTAVWIDAAHALDADYASHCNIDLDNLLLVRPKTGHEALEIAGDFVKEQGADLLVIAPGMEEFYAPPGAWQKLAVRVAKSRSAVVMLSPEGNKPSSDASHVSLRLHIERMRWLWNGEALVGWESRAKIVKNKLGPAGQEMMFGVKLPEPAS